MLIGELSRRSGFSRDTIRFYEKQGLIQSGRKERRFNNYKEYSEETLKQLLIIKRVKGFGFTLNEIKEFLQMIADNEASCNNVAERIAEKVSLIDGRIKQLQDIRLLMTEGVAACLEEQASADLDENCPMLIQD